MPLCLADLKKKKKFEVNGKQNNFMTRENHMQSDFDANKFLLKNSCTHPLQIAYGCFQTKKLCSC